MSNIRFSECQKHEKQNGHVRVVDGATSDLWSFQVIMRAYT